MSLVALNSEIEEWLAAAASSFSPLSDREYRLLVGEWRAEFEAALDSPKAVQAPEALAALAERLPASLHLFNGVSVPRASVSAARSPLAYHVVALRQLNEVLANAHDLVFVDEHRTFCCVCTHEWQALSHPLFVARHAA